MKSPVARVKSFYGACSKDGFSLGQRYFADDSSSCKHNLAALPVRYILKCLLVVLQIWNITSYIQISFMYVGDYFLLRIL